MTSKTVIGRVAARLLKILDEIENYIMVSGISVAVILVLVQVILRYVFNLSISWIEEAVRYIIVWMSFVGASMGLRNKSHIAVDLLLTLLPEKPARLVAIIGALLGCMFSIALIWYGLALVQHALAMEQLSSAMLVPMGWVYLVLPVSGLFLLIRFVQMIGAIATGARPGRIDAVEHASETTT